MNQTKDALINSQGDENYDSSDERKQSKDRRDMRRRSSFVRGRLSQAAVTLDVAGNCCIIVL